MQFNVEFAKHHWKQVAGGLFAAVVLYVLYEKFKGGSGSSTTADVSGGANQVQALTAAASLQNAQMNAGVEVAQLNASAGLTAALADTAAKLEAVKYQTQAQVALESIHDAAAVTTQRIVSDQAVATTKLQAGAITSVVAQQELTKRTAINQAASIQRQQIQTVNDQIFAMFKGSKHFQADIAAFAPVIALETGFGGAAPSLGQSNAAVKIGTSTGAQIGQAASGVGILAKGLTGLFK